MKKSAFLLLLIFCFKISEAQNLVSKLASAYSKFSNSTQLKYATFSFSAIDNKTGKFIFSKNDLG